MKLYSPHIPKVAVSAIFSAALILFGAGCGQTPQQKVDSLEKTKSAQVDNSGYNECIKKVNDREAEQNKCVTDSLAKDGYTDGIDCIQDFDSSTMSFKHPQICNAPDQKRYNAQVKAVNDCQGQFNDPKALTQFDCVKLLQK